MWTLSPSWATGADAGVTRSRAPRRRRATAGNTGETSGRTALPEVLAEANRRRFAKAARLGRESGEGATAGWMEGSDMPQWRKSTWALAIWNVLMLAWLARVLSGLDDFSCARETGGFGLAACQAGATIGQNFGVALVGVIWLVGLVGLGVIWLASRPRSTSR